MTAEPRQEDSTPDTRTGCLPSRKMIKPCPCKMQLCLICQRITANDAFRFCVVCNDVMGERTCGRSPSSMRLKVLSTVDLPLEPTPLAAALLWWPLAAPRTLLNAWVRSPVRPADVDVAAPVPQRTKRAPMTKRVRWRRAARGSRSRCMHDEEPISRSCCSRVLPAFTHITGDECAPQCMEFLGL